MNGGQIASLIASLMMLAWIVHGFSGRGVPMKQTVKMAMAWVAIFAVGLLLYSLLGGDGSTGGGTAPQSNLV